MGTGMGWGMCYRSIEREHKDYGDGEGCMCYCSMGDIYEQDKKVTTHDSDEMSNYM